MATIDSASHAIGPKTRRVIETFDRYVVPNYRRFPICLVKGEGSRVWDAEGHEYLDLFPGWGCNLLGHCPEPIVRAVQEQVASKRAELDEQKRQMLEQQRQVRELEMEQIVEQGQIESFCEVRVGDNLVEKLQAAVLVRDGLIEAIEAS